MMMIMMMINGVVCSRAMAQAVSRRSLTVEARVCVFVIPCGISGGKSDIWTGFLLVLRSSPVSIITP
jgi:hypothetical protein